MLTATNAIGIQNDECPADPDLQFIVDSFENVLDVGSQIVSAALDQDAYTNIVSEQATEFKHTFNIGTEFEL